MKKIALSLVLAAGLGVAACSQPAEEATTEAPEATEGAMTEAEATTDAAAAPAEGATTEAAPADAAAAPAEEAK